MDRMPALFIGHGSPMNTLELNRFTQAWRTLGAALPRPRPRTIHDFYGFPQALFDFDYPAPGAPDVAHEIVEAVKPRWAGLDLDQWGLDHGTWSVLAHLYPDADVPTVQLSINALQPLEYHVDLAARLAPLRERGVMILSSGNVVHNLKRVRWKEPDAAFDWAQRFDEAAIEQMAQDPGAVLKLAEHADYELAVPTPDHFIPLLYTAGLAAAGEGTANALLSGYSMGSLSMTCYGVGVDAIDLDGRGTAAASLPPDVPPEQTNT